MCATVSLICDSGHIQAARLGVRIKEAWVHFSVHRSSLVAFALCISEWSREEQVAAGVHVYSASVIRVSAFLTSNNTWGDALPLGDSPEPAEA